MKVKEYRAAGGVVLDNDGRVLLLERDVERGGRVVHEVRLPKGHVEAGESDEQAAVREVCEESGYCDLHILADLGENRVEFERSDKAVRRDERYYLMRLAADRNRGQNVKPGSEEALFRPLWAADLVEAERRLTFASEREFARRAAQALSDHPRR